MRAPTHDHLLDQACVEALGKTPLAYLGVNGSQREAQRFRQRMETAGFAPGGEPGALQDGVEKAHAMLSREAEIVERATVLLVIGRGELKTRMGLRCAKSESSWWTTSRQCGGSCVRL